MSKFSMEILEDPGSDFYKLRRFFGKVLRRKMINFFASFFMKGSKILYFWFIRLSCCHTLVKNQEKVEAFTKFCSFSPAAYCVRVM